MIKVIMIVVTAIFLSSWYACLVAGKRADEEISALFEKEKKQGTARAESAPGGCDVLRPVEF